MGKPVIRSDKDTIPRPGIFSLLKPYSGIVILLIIMALLGSGINMLIPKIIAHGIDAFSAGHFDGRLISYSVFSSGICNIHLYLPSKHYSDICLRKSRKRSAHKAL